ncbi:hypothetical protein D3C84_688630 [compost metagenome]
MPSSDRCVAVLKTVGKKVVFWSVVCWEAVKLGGEWSIARPFATEQKAQWAAQVLTAHYPGRAYALLRHAGTFADNLVAHDRRVRTAFKLPMPRKNLVSLRPT